MGTTYRSLNLGRREADVAIRMAPSAPPHLMGRKHAEVMHAVYGSTRLLARFGENVNMAMLPWASWDLGHQNGTDRYLKSNLPKAKVVVRVETFALMQKVLLSDMAVTIMPCMIGDRCPELRRVGDYFEGGFFLWVLTHPELRKTVRVYKVIEHLRALIRRDIDLIEGRCPIHDGSIAGR
ncbi:MAG: LysR substrate-binding domain-containing protein [Myxococcota bacterium]